MADFRKWFLVLAVLAAFVIPASAQTVCTVSSTNQPVRAEGIAELVGSVSLICAPAPGTTPAATTASFIAFFGANVTSPITDAATLQTAAVLTSPAVGSTPTRGTLSGTNSLIFNNVSVPAAGGIFTISGVRVNASNAAVGSNITVIMSASSPANDVLFNGIPTTQVATVQTGLEFSTATTGSTAVPASFTQCSAPTIKLIDLNFKEGFAAAFKGLGQENAAAVPPGTATQGTRLFASFGAVPGNVNIAVPGFLPTTATSIADATAILVGFDNTVGGNSLPITAVPGTLTPIKASTDPNNLGSAFSSGGFLVPLSGGAGVAVYELTGTGLTAAGVETVTLTAALQITSGVATTTTAVGTVSGGFAPVSTVVTAVPATGTGSAPIPRFVNVAVQNKPLLSVAPCVTNLLFPFVTNQAGFDTGIALVNTSLDNAGSKAPFNTTPQHGSCTVFFFNGTTSAPTPQTTADIPAGGMAAFNLQGGDAAGFQGYIIAQCNFQFAHGFAFISDRNNPSLGSQGYLALVIPDRGGARPALPFTTNPGTGEMLAQ